MAAPVRHLLIPMAGAKRETDSKYWPFVRIGSKTIVEHAVESFRDWMPPIEEITFVVLREHEDRWAVRATLSSLIGDIQHTVVDLDEPTAGPAQTAAAAIRAMSIEGSVVVSDVDHAVRVDALLERFSNDLGVDVAVPLWDLQGEDVKRWAVAAVQSDGDVVGIAEKRLPAGTGAFAGVIGCYAFRDAATLAHDVEVSGSRWLSEIVQDRIDAGEAVVGIPAEAADLYGDIQHVRRAQQRSGVFSGTVFCDLDGTLVEHCDEPVVGVPLKLLAGSVESVTTWVEQGYEVVIATARSREQEPWIASELRRQGVPFHRVIAELPSGPRVVVNDRKPSAILSPQAVAVEVERDRGVADVRLSHPRLRVAARLTGGSVAETLLVEDDERLFVRKRVTKRGDLSIGYTRLRAQARALERFEEIYPGFVPRLERELDDRFEYFFDLEYLADYDQLSQLDTPGQRQHLDWLVQTLAERFYRHDRLRHPNTDWLVAHLSRKIHARMDVFLGAAALRPLVTSETVVINGAEYPSITTLLGRLEEPSLLEQFAPLRLTAVHGDLTFENVLVKDDDVRVIDMDGADYLDAPELDLGKLYQSSVGRYETWAHSPAVPIKRASTGRYEIDLPPAGGVDVLDGVSGDAWARALVCSREEAHRKGLFYMGLHFLRMAPFRLRVSPEQALYAGLLAIRHLGLLTDRRAAWWEASA